MTSSSPHYELTRIISGEVDGTPEIVPITEVPLDTVMGRRGALGLGLSAAALMLTVRDGNAQRAVAGRGSGEPRAPYPTVPAHIQKITSLRLLPKLGLLASASSDNTVKLWSLSDGALGGRCLGHRDDVEALAVTGDENLLISASRDGTVRSWGLPIPTAGAVVAEMPGPIGSVAVSPNGQWLVTAVTGSSVRIWSLTDSRLHASLPNDAGASVLMGISPDGQTLTTRSAYGGGNLAFWSLPNGALKRTLKVTDLPSNAILSSNQALAASWTYGGRLSFTNLADGSTTRSFELGRAGDVQVLALSSDDRLIALGSRTGEVRVHGSADGVVEATFTGIGPVSALVFTADARGLISAHENGVIALWDLSKKTFVKYLADPQLTRKNTDVVRALRAHRDTVSGLAISRDGTVLLSASSDKTAKAWSFPQGELVAQCTSYQAPVNHVLVAGSDGSIVTSSGPAVVVWQLPTTVKAGGGTGGRGNAGSGARRTVAEVSPRFEIRKGTSAVISISGSPSSALVASAAADRMAFISSLTDGTDVRAIEVGDGSARIVIRGLSYSPDGSLLAVRIDREVRLHVADDGRLLAVLADTASTSAIAWSPDGKSVAVGTDGGEVIFWSSSDGKPQGRAKLASASKRVAALTFTPDGTRLVAGGADGAIMVASVDRGRVLGVAEGHGSEIVAIALTPDGRTVVSASTDRTIRLWDIDALQQVAVLEGHTNRISAMLMSADGKWLVTGDAAGVIALWDLSRRALHTYLFDPVANDRSERARTFSVFDRVTGQILTYTLPCGSPLPANATCTCNCVPGTLTTPRASGGGGVFCACNRVCTCIPIFR